MTDAANNKRRTRGTRLVILLLVISFAFIPVRCDASTAPHSIFSDPISPETADAPSASADMHHQHHAGMAMADSQQSQKSEDGCLLAQIPGTDLSTQQPVGAALDLPATPVAPEEAALLPLDGEPIMRASAQETRLQGLVTPPDAPPPKAS